MLLWSMRHRWAVVGATVLTFLSIVPLGMAVGKDFLPKDDQSEFEIAITTPAGWSLKEVNDTFLKIEDRVQKYPGVTHELDEACRNLSEDQRARIFGLNAAALYGLPVPVK